ncbi:hypothetical protein NC653_003282 [Populus alba x Populus x berolinensis]|uniref:RRM domain-containing protein n=1 Tax=Populus alba x Populus x berolinensis TaxID=444605 RepID=A0AAD6RR37_9ROSI|nr:hypothetical protein NC653_003282 [Populus alba x Populus x berolinensis]
MPSLAVKQFSTGAADARTKKIQQPPPPNDGAAPPNNLSLPSNDVEELQDLRFKVFVGGLDKYAKEEDLRKVFGAVEEVTKVRLSWDSESQKRVAFLTFATVELARRAICEISDPVINGKRCWTAQIQDGIKTLYVPNICKEWTKDDLEDKLAEYGVKNYEVLTLNPDRENKEKNRGHAVLDFRSRKDASEALELLEKENVSFGQNRAAKADFSRIYISGNDEIMSHVKRVYLDGIPRAWREEEIKKHLNEFGSIVKVELASHIPSAIRTNYCYVTFETHEAAATCVNGVNVDGLYFRDNRVNAWADLAKPRVRIPSEGTAQASSSIGLGNEVQQDSHRSHKDAPSAIDRSERSEVRIPSEGTAQASGSVAQGIGLGNEVQKDSHRSHADAPSALDRSERSEVRIPSEGTAQASSSIGLSIGLGNDVQQDSHRSHTDAPSALDRSERSEISCKPYNGGPREASSPGDRNAVSHGVGRRKQFPSQERLNTGRPSVPSQGISRAAAHRPSRHNDYSYERNTKQPSNYCESHIWSKRPHSAVEEVCPRRTEPFVQRTRARVDHNNFVRKEHSSRTGYGGEGVAHRPSRHNDYSCERNTKQPSNYYESHSRDYKYPSGSIRPHSSMEEVRPRSSEPFVQRSRARVDDDNSYRSNSQRQEHSSRTGFGEGASSSVRNSLGLSDTRASTVASRGCEVDRGDDRRMPSRYGKDYTSRDQPRSASDDAHEDSHRSDYHHSRVKDSGSSSRRGSRKDHKVWLHVCHSQNCPSTTENTKDADRLLSSNIVTLASVNSCLASELLVDFG